MNELADIDMNCIIYDDTLKTNTMEIGKTWQWASHQPLIKGVLDLYSPRFILELGIGENSTPLFAGLNYLGVENDKEWIKHIGSTCRANQLIMWHDLDRQKGTLAEYYDTIPLPEDEPKLLFVDNYESCRAIAINTLRNKFDIVIFHDCEPEPGARVNHYGIVNSEGFNVYFLKTSANWTAVMIRTSIDIGFGELLLKVNKHIAEFKHKHPDMKEMFFDNVYQR